MCRAPRRDIILSVRAVDTTVEMLRQVADKHGGRLGTIHALALEFVMREQLELFEAFLEKNSQTIRPFDIGNR